jgi:flagellar hook protein FlgE
MHPRTAEGASRVSTPPTDSRTAPSAPVLPEALIARPGAIRIKINARSAGARRRAGWQGAALAVWGISSDGTVSAVPPDSGGTAVQVGQITLAELANPTGMLQNGQTTFLETDSSGPPQVGTPGENGLGTLQAGSLEGSNVSVVPDLVNLILAQRTFNVNSNALQAGSRMEQDATDLIPLA